MDNATQGFNDFVISKISEIANIVKPYGELLTNPISISTIDTTSITSFQQEVEIHQNTHTLKITSTQPVLLYISVISLQDGEENRKPEDIQEFLNASLEGKNSLFKYAVV